MSKIIVEKLMFAYSPYQNRVKGIPTYHFCERSFVKRTKQAIQNIVFCTRSLAKQDKSYQEGGLEKHVCSRSLTKQGEGCFETQVLSTVPGETD